MVEARPALIDNLTMKFLTIALFGLFGATYALNAEVKETALKAEHKYLYLPISAGQTSKNFELSDPAAGKILLDYKGQIHTTNQAPDWVVPIDISSSKGRELKFRMDTPDGKMPILLQGDYPHMENSHTPMWKATRPAFHFSPEYGAMGNPLGLVLHGGKWHLFYQADPYGIEFGKSAFVGHAVSDDLLNWKELSPLLIPEKNKSGGFSSVQSGSFYFDSDNSSGKFQKSGFIFAASDETNTISFYASPDLSKLEKFSTLKFTGKNPRLFRDTNSKLWILLTGDGSKIELRVSKDFIEWEKTQEFSDFGECASLVKMPVTGANAPSQWVLLFGNGKYYVGEFTDSKFLPQFPKREPRMAFMGPVDDAITATSTNPRTMFIASMRVKNLNEIKESHQPFVNSMTLPWQMDLVKLCDGEFQLRLSLPDEIGSRLEQPRDALGTDDIYISSNLITLPDAYGNRFVICAKIKNQGANVLNIEVGANQVAKYLNEPRIDLKFQRKSIGKYPVQFTHYDENIDFWFFLDSFGAELLFDAGDLLLFIPADLRGPQYEIRIGSVGSIWSNYIGKSTIRRLPNSEIIKRANARLKKLIK